MIVSQTDSGWQIIHQQAHGLLAIQLALHWRTEKRPARWVETLTALTEHDDGQDSWDGHNHLTSAGTPLHFELLSYSVEQCRQLIQIGLQKSRWNALLVSMHTSFLYESKRGTDKALDEFLDQQITNQTKWRKESKATKEEADYAYGFLQWCDALSLVLCLSHIPPEGRRLEVSMGPDGLSYYIFQRTDGTLGLDPWPFEESPIQVHVETFCLEQVVFKNDKQLYNALQDSAVIVKEWTFQEHD
jgi:hypothetical protein